jgi:hypothetical protein
LEKVLAFCQSVSSNFPSTKISEVMRVAYTSGAFSGGGKLASLLCEKTVWQN